MAGKTRRTIALAVAALAMLAAAPSPAGAQGEPGVEIGVEDDFFSPRKVALELGDPAPVWVWDLDGTGAGSTDSPHDVVSEDDLFGSDLRSSGRFEVDPSAGGYDYLCTIHPGMTGRLRVKPRAAEAAASSQRVRVAWAAKGTQTGNRYDVRYRVGGGDWRRWFDDTKRRSASFGRRGRPEKLAPGERYELEARSQRGRAEKRRSDWSPTLELRT